MNHGAGEKDGRVLLLERLLANARLTRTNKRTDTVTAKFAADLEEQYTRQIADLQSQQPAQPIQEAA